MERPGRGRRIDQGRRTVPGTYFDLACAIVGITQEELARRAGVPASAFSRIFNGQIRGKRKNLLAWSDILLELCPSENKDLLRAMEAEMLHTLGYATRDDEQNGIERLDEYQQQVNEILSQRKLRPS